MSAPPDRREPRLRPHDRCQTDGPRPRAFPPREPCRRRARIESAAARAVPVPVSQHIDQRGPDLPRRRQRPGMVALGPEGPPAMQRPVHRPRDADLQPLESAREPGAIVGLDEQVDVVGLDRELEHAEAAARGGGQRVADGAKDASATEGGQRCPDAEGAVHGVPRLVRRAAAVRDPAARPGGAAGVRAHPAPGPRAQRKLDRASHDLNGADQVVVLGCERPIPPQRQRVAVEVVPNSPPVGPAPRGRTEPAPLLPHTDARAYRSDATETRASSMVPDGKTPSSSVATPANRIVASRYGRVAGASIGRVPSVMYICTRTPR